MEEAKNVEVESQKDEGQKVDVRTEDKKSEDTKKQETPKSENKKNPKEAAPAESAETPQEKQSNGPLPHGVVPDQVQVNQALGQVMNDIEALKARAARLLNGSDYEKLSGYLVKAQDVAAEKLGLKKAKTNGYVNPEQVEQK